MLELDSPTFPTNIREATCYLDGLTLGKVIRPKAFPTVVLGLDNPWMVTSIWAQFPQNPKTEVLCPQGPIGSHCQPPIC